MDNYPDTEGQGVMQQSPYNEVNELAGELHAAVFEETTDTDQVGNIDTQFAAELQEIKNNVILAKSLYPKK